MLENDENDWMKEEQHKDEAEMYTYSDLCGRLNINQEYFIAYKIVRFLLMYDGPLKEYASYHGLLGSTQYIKASELVPNDGDSMNRIGHCSECLEDSENAANYFRNAVEADPNNYAIVKECGNYFVRNRDFHAADEPY